mmetsp:Transcript_33865/g.118471  ORF Transcript_33865/g.118471 Transcript_33865/m.118471 type:complete len:666 (-) Transcript_33865:370-2367(-)
MPFWRPNLSRTFSASWVCPRCTLQNQRRFTACQACGAAFDEAAPPQPGPPNAPLPMVIARRLSPQVSQRGLPPVHAAPDAPPPYYQPYQPPAASSQPFARAHRPAAPQPSAVSDDRASAPRPRSLEEFVRSGGAPGAATMQVTVLLCDGTQLELTTTIDADQLRGRLRSALFEQHDRRPRDGDRRPRADGATARGDGAAAPRPRASSADSPRADDDVFRALPSQLAASHVENLANAGAAGGEAFARDHQVAVADAVRSYGDGELDGEVRRAFDKFLSRPEAGSRVNAPTTGGTTYDRDAPFETQVGLNAERFRQRSGPAPERNPDASLPLPPDRPDSNIAVPFEVASVGAKIRNTARVAGQRVEEMDHFVEEIRTPIIEVRDADDSSEGARLGARRAMERGLRDSALEQDAAEVDVGASLKMLCLAPDRGRAAVYGAAFVSIAQKCFAVLGWGDFEASKVRLYYMPSIRANEMVCARGGDDDRRLYVNVLAFEQSRLAEAHVGPSELAAVIPYWVQRFANASRDGAADARPPASKGLYDPAVRQRLAVLAGLPRQALAPVANAPKPPPVPETPLRRETRPAGRDDDARGAEELTRRPQSRAAVALEAPVGTAFAALRAMFPAAQWDDAALRWLAAQGGADAACEMVLGFETAAQMRSQLNDACVA